MALDGGAAVAAFVLAYVLREPLGAIWNRTPLAALIAARDLAPFSAHWLAALPVIFAAFVAALRRNGAYDPERGAGRAAPVIRGAADAGLALVFVLYLAG